MSAVRREGVCPARTFFGQGGSSDVDVRTFGAKNFRFFEIYGASAQTREVEPVRTFYGQEGGGNFSGFYADLFYGRTLTNNAKILIVLKGYMTS